MGTWPLSVSLESVHVLISVWWQKKQRLGSIPLKRSQHRRTLLAVSTRSNVLLLSTTISIISKKQTVANSLLDGSFHLTNEKDLHPSNPLTIPSVNYELWLCERGWVRPRNQSDTTSVCLPGGVSPFPSMSFLPSTASLIKSSQTADSHTSARLPEEKKERKKNLIIAK